MKREQFLQKSALGIFAAITHTNALHTEDQRQIKDKRFSIGACDWSISNTSNLGAMEMAKEIGLDGVQLSLGLKANNMHLRRKDVQEAYKSLAKIFKVGFTGLGIGELNNYPFKSDPQTDQWVADSIQVAKEFNIKAVLIAFFNQGDLKNDPKGQDAVIQKFKDIMPIAEKAGVTLGIESWLSADEHMRIIDAVGSTHLKVYYDVANSEKMGTTSMKKSNGLVKKIKSANFILKRMTRFWGREKWTSNA